MATKSKRRDLVHAAAPFGAPDGATGDLREVEAHFIEVEQDLAAHGLASRPDDRMVRVFVGKKGVGKTTYLRRFQASASDESSVFAAAREASPPSTDDVVRVCGYLRRDSLAETWQMIWRRAIQRSVVTNLLPRPQPRPYLTDEVEERLSSPDLTALTPTSRVPTGVYAEVSAILGQAHTRHQLGGYLHHDRWPEIEYWLTEALRDAPPI